VTSPAQSSERLGRAQRIRLRLATLAHALKRDNGSQAGTTMPYTASRRRLVLINLLVVSGILLAMAIFVYAWEAHVSDQQVNEQLIHWAARGAPADAVPTDTSDEGASSNAHSDVETYEPSSPNVFSVIINQQGKVTFDPGNVGSISGLPDLAAAQPVLHGEQASTLVTVGSHDSTYRLYTVPIVDHGNIVGALQTGTSLAARDRTLHDLFFTLLGVSIVCLLLTAGASLYLADRALVPMVTAYERQHRFTAAASHELRTPLAIVRSQAELVERSLQRVTQSIKRGSAVQAETLEQTRSDVREIVDEVDYMTRLVRDLLTIARDESDSRGLSWSSVDVRALARDLVGRMQPQAERQHLALTLSDSASDQPAAIVRGDADRLRQLILVLVENAIRYTPAGGAITVGVRTSTGRRILHGHGGNVLITVSDTGQGIAPDELPRIFEPFYRARHERTSQDDHTGAGLGLALARWIVAAHGGEITVTSTLGKGTTFIISIPQQHDE